MVVCLNNNDRKASSIFDFRGGPTLLAARSSILVRVEVTDPAGTLGVAQSGKPLPAELAQLGLDPGDEGG